MMRHSNSFRPAFGFIGLICTYMAIAYSVSSCIDDTFNKYQQEETGLLTFDVEVPNNWTNGLSRAATDISIKKMSQSDDAEPLYLVTEILEATANAAASDAVTRGTPVTSTDKFYDNFGLSAICYTGEWPTEEPTNWNTNFARNLKVSKGTGTTWNTEEELNWLGSGKIRFFAYSPYSATDKPENGISYSNTTIPTLTYTVPEDVKAQCDLMTAMEDCPGGQGGAVSLKFKHTLTAVTIKTGQKMLEGTITKVSLTGVHGKGTHQIGSDKWTTTSETTDFEVALSLKLPEKENSTDTTPNEEKDIVDYAKPGEEIVGGELTFMMVPQTLPTDAKLIVEFTDSLTHTPRTLTAKLEGSEWPMGKKVAYSISSTGIIVEPVIDLKINHNDIWMNGEAPATKEEQNAYLPVSGYLHDVQLAAYAKVVQEGHSQKHITLPFQIQYSIDNGTNWQSTTEGINGWLPAPQSETTAISTLEDTPSIPFVSGSLLLPAQAVFDDMRKPFNITSKSNKGTIISPYDLTQGGETANCYIVNEPGYYSLPLVYGNARNAKDKSYKFQGTSNNDSTLLKNFVDYNNQPITQPTINNAESAALIWQDTPDLVTDVKLNETKDAVIFRVPREALNQGNAVIAIRDENGIILWSWHIWATHYDWINQDFKTTSKGYDKVTYSFSPCNLGYCDPHEGNESRKVQMRFLVTLPNGVQKTLKENIKLNGEQVKNGIIEFNQPEVVASIAGDNTYYQWGRKDPMLPGIYNLKILSDAGNNYQFNMKNKVFYSNKDYKFTSAESGVSIGQTIKEPYHFFMHKKYPNTDKDYANHNYLRRHWHDGTKVAYGMKTIMNFWNSQLDKQATKEKLDYPCGEFVTKTIYDPCPVGYKIPTPNAFSQFSDSVGVHDLEINARGLVYEIYNNRKIGWYLSLDGSNDRNSKDRKIFFPATGLRDMGADYEVNGETRPAHADLTFIATAAFAPNGTNESSCLLFYLDNRPKTVDKGWSKITINGGTNNAYGFTIRPIRDDDEGKHTVINN